MSFTGPSVGSAAAGRAIRRTFEFGRTYVVRPKGKHQATIVWLHGLGDNGNSDDLEGLDTSAAYVASLLANEPPNIKLGVGGFSMGAATSLYSATCFAYGKYGNGNQYSANLSAVVGLSGWLPCAKNLSNKIEGAEEAAGRAVSLPILLCHGRGDDVVSHKFGEKSSEKLSSSGFRNMIFKSYPGLGHYTIPEEMDEVCAWLTSKLELEGQ